jgi:hypothetical protein
MLGMVFLFNYFHPLLRFFYFILMKGWYTDGNIAIWSDCTYEFKGASIEKVILTCDYTLGHIFAAYDTSSLSISQMTIISGNRNDKNIILFQSFGSFSLNNIKVEQTEGFYFINKYK